MLSKRSNLSDLAGTSPVALSAQAWQRTDQSRPGRWPHARPVSVRLHTGLAFPFCKSLKNAVHSQCLWFLFSNWSIVNVFLTSSQCGFRGYFPLCPWFSLSLGLLPSARIFSLSDWGEAHLCQSLWWDLTALAQCTVSCSMPRLEEKPHLLACSILSVQATVKVKWQVLEVAHFLSLNLHPLMICNIWAKACRFAKINPNGC